MNTFEKLLPEIGDRLVRLRLISGHASYETFANAHNLSRMQYWRIEKGKTNLTIKSLMRVLQIHDLSIEELFSKNFYRNFPDPTAHKSRKRSHSYN